MNKPQFIAVGISTRALLESVGQARSNCLSIDFFSDRDTRSGLLNSIRIHDFADALLHCVREGDPMRRTGILWAGGIENNIEVARSVEHCRQLRNVGCSFESMKNVRDPHAVADALKQAGIPALDIRSTLAAGEESQWIVKPLKSGGGDKVHLLEDAKAPFDPDYQYLQRLVHGPVYGASFIGRGKSAELIGCCRHLLSTSSKSPFRYEGSIGPMSMTQLVTRKLSAIGNVLANKFELRGWFGMDVVVNMEQVWLLEINPRFTSSMELLDGRSVPSLFETHLASFDLIPIDVLNPSTDEHSQAKRPVAAKATFFNGTNRDLFIDARKSDALWRLNQSAKSTVCDVPCPDWTAIPGSPVCSIRTEGDNESDVLNQLAQIKKAVTSILK